MRFFELLLDKLISGSCHFKVLYANSGAVFNSESITIIFIKNECRIEIEDFWGGYYTIEEPRMNRTNNEIIRDYINERTKRLNANEVKIKFFNTITEMLMDDE